jgi:membrane protein DedA with SNARE-associated domain
MEFITYFVSHHGYLAIFLLLAPGTFGIPVPDEFLLTFIGYLVLREDLQLIPALAVVVAGAILGITLDYWVGRAAGAKLIREAGAYGSIKPDKFERLKERLRRCGGWVLFLGYFIPGVRHWVAIAAGITGFPLAGFTMFAYSGALAWSMGYIFLGYFWGREADLLVERIGGHGQMAAGLIATLILGYLLIRGIWLRQRWPKIPGKKSQPVSL